jgi:PAS domain S-box-containing protein
MSEAGQDWARAGATVTDDGELGSFSAGGGALMLWNAATGTVLPLDDFARGLLAGSGEAGLPAATRERLALLAGGLAPRRAMRLERLRLTSGFAATLVTCGCKLIALPEGGDVLAIAIPKGELRRLGITEVQEPAQQEPAREQGGQEERIEALAAAAAIEPVPPQAQVAAPQRSTIRLLWTSDAAGRLTGFAPDAPELAGLGRAADLVGRGLAEIVADHAHDPENGLTQRLAGQATWSGQRLLWRSATSDEGVRIEFSGAPILDSARQFAGFRGFGLVRLGEREAWPMPPATPEPDTEADSALAADDGQAGMVATPARPDPEPELESTGDAPDFGDIADAPAAPGQIEMVAVDLADETEDAEHVAAVTPAATEAPGLAEGAGAIADDIPAPAEDMSGEADDATVPETAAEPGEDGARDDEAGQDEAAVSRPAAIVPEVPPPAPQSPGANIFPLRNGHLTAVRPVLEPGKPHLSSAERNAFREIAKALGARIAGEDEVGPRLPPVAPLRLKDGVKPEPRATEPSVAGPAAEIVPAIAAPEPDATETQRQRLPNSHADVLDRLPIAVLVNRGDEALYANRTLLDLLDYADLDDLKSGGTVSRLIKEAARTDGGAMVLIDRTGHLVGVNAMLSSVSWLNEPATLMAFRNAEPGGEVKVMTLEEAEAAELAAEFAAEDEESAARVEALRLDVDAREARIGELTAMLDTATDGVVTVDERGRMLSLNKAAEALFGYDQREVTGDLFTLLFAAESHAPALDYLEGLKGGGVASVMNDGREVVGRVRQGGKIPLFMTMGQIAHGSDRRFCAVLRDITAWKKTEGELVEARKAAEKASAQKSDVLAKISHEIRTPLNAIIGFAEVMAEERFGPIANERYKEYLRDIHQSGGYVISLVNDLLDLAKIEAGRLDLDFESVSLNEIALSAVALLQPEAQRGRVVLRSGLSPKLPPVVADERSLRQIVLNLLSNAVKFTDAGGQVIVSTALGDQGEAILRVRDTGIGMDDAEIALALEPFRQVPATRRAGGTGLGLPLTKALVEANRAAMAITSVKKEGTLVEITFPPQRVLAG